MQHIRQIEQNYTSMPGTLVHPVACTPYAEGKKKYFVTIIHAMPSECCPFSATTRYYIIREAETVCNSADKDFEQQRGR